MALLARLVALGVDPAEEIRNGLTAIDVALTHQAFTVVRWLLDQRVAVTSSLQVVADRFDPD